MNDESTRYFMRFGKHPWDECTYQEFSDAERAAGFNGPTGGFSSGSINATKMYRQAYFDWSEGVRLLTPLPLLKEDCFDIQALGSFFDLEGYDHSEKERQRRASTTEWHISNAVKALDKLKDNALILADPTPTQRSREILRANLEMIVDVMRRNLDNRTNYSEVKKRYNMR